jgi:4-amino-4-deoxy-L-arabinose transferase-like glycosyltransferase
MNETAAGRRKFPPLSILGAFVFFAILWRLDFPRPSYDDLFQSGAALNMAQGGDFSDPFLVRQEFPSHYYFVYPPLHSYLFAGWLKLFGISAVSATAYPMLCCFVIAAATIIILRRHGASVWLEWFVPLGVSFGILYLALRPEPPGIALAMTGLALTDADATHKRASYQFTGLLLLIFGASAAPRVTIFIASLAFYAGYRTWQAASNARERWRVAVWWLAAVAIAFLAFLAMIHFRLAEFLHTFAYHASGRLYKDRLASIRDYLFKYLGYLQIPIVILPLLLLPWALKRPKDDLSLPAFFLAGAIPFVLWTGGIGSATAWWAFLMLMLLLGSLSQSIPRGRAVWLYAVIFLFLVVINRKNIAQSWGLVSGNIRPDFGPEIADVRSLRPTPGHPMLVDSWVARYVYDYRLPEGVIDAEWCVRFPGAGPGSYRVTNDTSPQLRNGDIFVVGNYMRRSLEVYTMLDPVPLPMWSFLGLNQLSFEKYPRWVYIIPSENCKEVRTNASMVLPSDK